MTPVISDAGAEGSGADSGTTASNEAPPRPALGVEQAHVLAPGFKEAQVLEGSSAQEPPAGTDEAAANEALDDEAAFSQRLETATSAASEAPVVETPIDSVTTAADDPGRDSGPTNEKRVGGAGRAAGIGSSVMIHMDHFDASQEAHTEKMERTLVRLSNRFPKAGMKLQLGTKFYSSEAGQVQEEDWTYDVPPPVVTRMSAVQLPKHGRCVLVEGEHLTVPGMTSTVAAPTEATPPLVLYCIRPGVVQAEKLRPMFSTPDGRKALFAAPVQPLQEGSVTLRLRRAHAFSPDVHMTADWLRRPADDSSPCRAQEGVFKVTERLHNMHVA
eukprot:CAMPEP_0206149392 /NCGR_PEP_ID=MMETSP1473-20131121/37751_1 /ASSEMBLY_ACC=CAM_ASM_001109 /TAXON_ID=1461547 /ORGANISM="Stichococcus sp, Strain RCC1054" /LENGTH=328 /DNA_ID=CAMNT_0053546853 /DNA_START=1107 /DNA_END=2093 /DNA_ORIENTATION=+